MGVGVTASMTEAVTKISKDHHDVELPFPILFLLLKTHRLG
jgi:hypothetical protein